MKKFVSLLLSAILVVSCLSMITVSATSVVDSGTCGENLTWTLDSEGTFTISGTGKMNNYYYYGDVPWYMGESDIKAVNVEEGVTSIGDYAFSYCSSLTSVEIPDSVTSIGDCAFCACSSLTSVSIGNSVTSIGVCAFFACSSLTSIEIPDSVTSIGDSAFDNCSSLTSIEIPDSVTSIGSYAFSVCSSLTSVSIGNSVTSIGDCAFVACRSLTSIEIPDSVTSIGYCAFGHCGRLTSVSIGNSVTSIGNSAFEHCSSLTDVYYKGTEEEWNKISIAEYNDGLENATIHYNHKPLEENFGFYGASITLKENFALNFYVKPEIFENFENVQVKIEFDGKTVYPSPVLNSGYYMYTLNSILPSAMSKTATATITGTAGGKEYSESIDYSVMTYCKTQLADTSLNTTVTNLITDTINYGAAVQSYLGQTSDLVNAELSDDDKNRALVVPEMNNNFALKEFSEETNVDWYSASLVLTESIAVNFKFETTEDVTGYYVMVNGKKISSFKKNGNVYTAQYSDINPSQMKDILKATVYNANGEAVTGELTYSPESYCARMYGKGNAKLDALIAALMVYGNSAAEYKKIA